jgi:acylphosphatase
MASTVSRIRRRVVVYGRVQGVWFRGATCEEAQRLGADGWVRNRPDGAVEAVFEGDPASVQSLLRFCERGPGPARVERVEIFEEEPEGVAGFEIAR